MTSHESSLVQNETVEYKLALFHFNNSVIFLYLLCNSSDLLLPFLIISHFWSTLKLSEQIQEAEQLYLKSYGSGVIKGHEYLVEVFHVLRPLCSVELF